MKNVDFRAALALAALATPVAAQEAAPQIIATYQAAEFERFAPKTAFDMVVQVPGFSIREADERRGLGQSGANVLIDGQRIGAKNVEAEEALRRISAGRVERLEIVDGASLQIAGLSGQVLNVVTSPIDLSGQFSYAADVPTYGFDPQWRNFSLSVSGSGERLTWTISAENDSFAEGRRGPETVSLANGTVIERREEHYEARADRPTLSGNLKYEAAGTIANLRGEVGAYLLEQEEGSVQTPSLGDPRDVLFTGDQDQFSYEIAGDLALGVLGGTLKTIALHRYDETPAENLLGTYVPGGNLITATRFGEEPVVRETVLRSEFVWNAGTAEWKLGAEGAFNSLEQRSEYATAGGDGIFILQDLAGDAAKVDEDRYEAEITHTRPLSSKITLQLSGGAEYSRISQSGDLSRQRDFFRPKGFASLSWKPEAGLDLSAKIEREVGQLEFLDFITSVNLRNQTIDATNTEFVPAQTWRLEAEASKTLGAFGAVTLRGFGEKIDDIVDRIPIPGLGEAPGNIDEAYRHGIRFNATLLGDAIGWRGAKLDVFTILQESEVEDPVTGETRSISRDLESFYDVKFRHDLPDTSWAYGVELQKQRVAPLYRINDVTDYWYREPYTEVFVENKDVFGLTVRGSVGNVFTKDGERLERYIYEGTRADPLAVVERRERNFGVLFRLNIDGSF